MPEEHDPDRTLAEALVREGRVPSAHLKECLELLEQLKKTSSGPPPLLTDLLRRKGSLAEDPDAVRDVGALPDWIAQQPELDAQRVAVIGGSYGGYMVPASLVMHGERIRAGVDIVGIANFISFLEKTSAYRQDLRRVEYGDERDPEMRAFFQEMSPYFHADRIRSALLVARGKNDRGCRFSRPNRFIGAWRARGSSSRTTKGADSRKRRTAISCNR